MDESLTLGFSDSQTLCWHWRQVLFTVDPEKVLPLPGEYSVSTALRLNLVLSEHSTLRERERAGGERTPYGVRKSVYPSYALSAYPSFQMRPRI